MTIPFSDLWWPCAVCGDARPDALISVAHRPIKGMEQSFPDSRDNVRYCNDRASCIEYATQPGIWSGAPHRYKVTVPIGAIDIEDLARMDQLMKQVPYDSDWQNLSGAVTAVVFLAASDPEAATRHAQDVLRAAGAEVLDGPSSADVIPNRARNRT